MTLNKHNFKHNFFFLTAQSPRKCGYGVVCSLFSRLRKYAVGFLPSSMNFVLDLVCAPFAAVIACTSNSVFSFAISDQRDGSSVCLAIVFSSSLSFTRAYLCLFLWLRCLFLVYVIDDSLILILQSSHLVCGSMFVLRFS